MIGVDAYHRQEFIIYSVLLIRKKLLFLQEFCKDCPFNQSILLKPATKFCDMAVPYIIVKQQNPGKRDETIYFARAVSNGAVDLEDLTRELEKMSTLSGADIHGVVYGLIDLASQHLSEGEIVHLGALGSLRVTLNREGRPSEEEIDEASIRRARLAFRPGDRMRHMLQTMTFRKKKA